MQITTDPVALAGSLCLGLPETVSVQSLAGDWPSDARLVLGSLAAPLATVPLTVSGTLATATIPAATVAAAHVATDGRPVPVVLLIGAGGSLDQVGGGRLWWRQESWGSDETQSLGAVVVGPAGPTAVSSDAGNAAVLGSDGLVFVAPGAVDPSILGVEWVQATPLATWTIPHSLGRRPAVALYIGGESVEADVAATSTTVVITLPSPMAGTAVLT